MYVKVTNVKPRGKKVVGEFVVEMKSDSGLIYIQEKEFVSKNIFKVACVGPDVESVQVGDLVVVADKDYVEITVNSNTEKLNEANVVIFEESVIQATLPK